jgi:hypothetical protein
MNESAKGLHFANSAMESCSGTSDVGAVSIFIPKTTIGLSQGRPAKLSFPICGVGRALSITPDGHVTA